MSQVNQVKLGARFIADEAHRVSHDRCLWAARMRRDSVAAVIPQWEEMRQLASEIKLHTLSHLADYLEMFEKNLKANGVIVHWAKDADEHNRIVADIFAKHNVKTVTKGKSMLMDECGMTPYLEKQGIAVYEADLGERIQQLDHQRPSHIVMPAIHKLRSDVARLFAEKLGSDPENDDPKYLNSVMRRDMRKNYIKVDAGMSGVNFGIAETGGIVVCTNEGNATAICGKHGHRETDTSPKGSRTVHTPAFQKRLGAEYHSVHEPLPWSTSRSGDAPHNRRQRTLPPTHG